LDGLQSSVGVFAMTFREFNWDTLASTANSGLQGQGAVVEAMHRVVDALDRHAAASFRLERIMIWLTVLILALTLMSAFSTFGPLATWITR